MKKRGKNRRLSNRLSYTLIAIGILVIISVGVYAANSLLTPGVSSNPGHPISQTSPPSGCAAGQVLQWTGTANADGGWACVTSSSQTVCPSGFHVAYTINYNEQQSNGADTYTDGTRRADTCNGDGANYYTCANGETKSCQDSHGPSPGCADNCWVRSVTCTAAITSEVPYCVPN
jgi:hypothetical protein